MKAGFKASSFLILVSLTPPSLSLLCPSPSVFVGETEGLTHCPIYDLISENGKLTAVSPAHLLGAALRLRGRLCVKGLRSDRLLS